MGEIRRFCGKLGLDKKVATDEQEEEGSDLRTDKMSELKRVEVQKKREGDEEEKKKTRELSKLLGGNWKMSEAK